MALRVISGTTIVLLSEWTENPLRRLAVEDFHGNVFLLDELILLFFFSLFVLASFFTSDFSKRKWFFRVSSRLAIPALSYISIRSTFETKRNIKKYHRVVFFCWEFFFLFSLKENGNLKIRKKIFARRHTLEHVQIIIYLDFFVVVGVVLRSETGHWRQGESTYWVYAARCWMRIGGFVDIQNLPSDKNINISAFRLNVLITNRFMHVGA